MEQLSHNEQRAPGYERDRTSFTAVAAERMAALREMVGKVTSPRALALVAALAGAGTLEAESAKADTFPGSYSSSEVYKDASKIFATALHSAHTSAEFQTQLHESLATKSDDEKLAVLGILGSALGAKYDYDMFKANDHVALGDDEIFTALKTNKGTVGICGNIHEEVKRLAESMGLEAFTASGTLSPGADKGYGGHIYSMVRADVVQPDGTTKKELVVINYGSVFPTGTDKLDEAMGAYEERYGTPSFFAQAVSLPDGEMVPIKTPASETLTGLADMNKSSREILTDGAIHPEHPELGFSVDSHLGTEDITLDSRLISFKYGHYSNPGDQFNSIASADSLTLGIHSPQGNTDVAGFSTEAKLNFTEATLENQNSEAIQFAAIELIKGYHSGKTELMTSEEFGKISGQFEAMARVGLALTVNGDKNIPLAGRAPNGEADLAMQYTVYINPNDQKEFYATAGVSGQMVASDFQTQKPSLRAGEYFVIGVDTEKFDGKVSYATDGVRKDTEASLSALFGKTTFDVTYESKSDFPGDKTETFGVSASKSVMGGTLTIGGFQTNGQKGASLSFIKRF
jgi:hypothetical protein